MKTSAKRFFFLCLICSFHLAQSDVEEELYDHVFVKSGYNSEVRPGNESGPLTIKMELIIKQLIAVNAKDQYLQISAWKHQEWYESKLYWDPSNFSGENHMHVKEENLWVPDTYLFNTLDIEEEVAERAMPVKMFPDTDKKTTRVIQLRPAILRSSCLMNVKHFPWDVQTCVLEYGSWSFPLEEIDYHVNGQGFSLDEEYVVSQEWLVHELSVERVVHDHHHDEFAILEYSIVLWRMPMYYIFNLIIPTVIITLISYLGLFSLSSSSGERGEKISLGMGTILALAVVMLMVQDSMPNTSLTNPMISWYFLILIVLEALALCATVFLVHLQNRGVTGQEMPSFLQRLCCVKKKKRKEPRKPPEMKKPKDMVMPNGTQVIGKRMANGEQQTKKQEAGELNQAILLEISMYLYDIRKFMHHLYLGEPKEDNFEEEYAIVTSRLEHLFFWGFTLVTLGVTALYLLLGYSSR